MTTTIARADLERRLRSAFRQKADQLVVRGGSLDLDAALESPVPVVEVTMAPPQRPRPRRRVALVATAIALVVLVIAAGVVSQSGLLSDGGSKQAGLRTRAIDETAGWLPFLAPSSIPSGLQLWSVNTQPEGGSPAFTSSQLFGALDSSGALAPGLLIETQPASSGDLVRPGGPADATVRGHDVTVDQAKDGGEGTQEFAWIEGDAEVRVTMRNTTVARAVEILDVLKPRGTSLQSGFDPASAPAGITQLAESAKGSSDPGIASFAYGHAAPKAGDAVELAVWTSTGPAYPGYARTWIAGSRTADGLAVEVDPGVGVFVSWPDGRQAVASSGTLDEATLVRVAKSAALLDRAGMKQLADGLARRIDTLPLLASVALPSGTLELRGQETLNALCLRLEGKAPVCVSPGAQQFQTQTGGGLAGQVQVDGKRLVFAAATVPPSVFDIKLADNGGFPPPLEAERATQKGWQLALVRVPAGVTGVSVSGANSERMATFSRADEPPNP